MELSSRVLAGCDSVPAPDVDALAPDPLADPRLAALPAHLTPLRILGQGGSSVVYEALHTRLKVKVALKLLTIDGPYADQAHADQARARMTREAELYALLDDPRIPRVYDVNELPDGTPYVVMEMVPGESLEELLLRHGPLAADQALSIAREVLLALASVHERGVLHRDVKPANVILTLSHEGPAQVRLVDFGIAKMSTRGTDEEAAVTQRGTLIGTPHYMAPERLAGHPADASTDVYAVGIMLYEMLSGVVPFTGSSLPSIIAAVMREVPESLEQRGVEVSPALSSLVMRAMAREPSDRFPSARDMLAALDALAGDEPQRVLAAVFDDDASGALPRRRARIWLTSGLLLAAAAGAALMLAEQHSEPSAQAQPVVRSPDVTRSAQAGSALAPQVRIPLSPLSLEPAAGVASDQAAPQPEPESDRTATEIAEARGSAREQERARQRRLREERREEEEAWREYRRRREAQREDDLGRQEVRAADFTTEAQILPENPY